MCGGRAYDDATVVASVLGREMQAGDVLVHGGASGADRLCEMFWQLLDGRTEAHPADWNRWGRYAGPRRNKAMVERGADLCIAFPGGRGTADTVRRCRAAGIPVKEIPRGEDGPSAVPVQPEGL